MDALRPFPRLLLALTICAAFAVALIGCSASQNTNTANSNATPAAGNTNKTTTAATPAAGRHTRRGAVTPSTGGVRAQLRV